MVQLSELGSSYDEREADCEAGHWLRHVECPSRLEADCATVSLRQLARLVVGGSISLSLLDEVERACGTGEWSYYHVGKNDGSG